MTPELSPSNRGARWPLFLPMYLIFFAYYRVLGFGYVWDDDSIFVFSAKFSSWLDIWNALFHPFLNNQIYFRPIPVLTLGLEQWLAQGDPRISHAVTLILHVMVSTLLAHLVCIVAIQRKHSERTAIWMGAAAGTLYALHPALIEVVAWVSCRFEMLMTLFAVSALLVDRCVAVPWRRAISVGVLFLMSALSKEMAVSCALILPFWHLLFVPPEMQGRELVRHQWRAHGSVYLAVLVSGLIYMAMRGVALGGVGVVPNMRFDLGGLTHVLVILKTTGLYVGLAFWPFAGLSPLHVLNLPLALLDPMIVLGAATISFAIALLIRAWQMPRSPSILLACFVISLLPVLNFIPLNLYENFGAERFLYFPLSFFCIWAVVQISEWKTTLLSPSIKKTVIAIVGSFWLILCFANLRVTLPFWRDNLSLWTWGYMRAPDAPTAQLNLQSAYLANDRVDKALELSREIKARNQGTMPVEVHRGYLVALSRDGQSVESELPQAEVEVEQQYPAHALGAEAASARNYMGWMYMSVGNLSKAEHWFRYALVADSRYSLSIYGLCLMSEVTERQDDVQLYCGRWATETHPRLRESVEPNHASLLEMYRDMAKQVDGTEKRDGQPSMSSRSDTKSDKD